jgi:uncharacterized membrane protein
MDVTLYEVLIFGHLTFVSAWVGGDVMLQALAFRARRMGPEKMVALMGDVEWIGLRLLTPASLLAAVFGFALVSEGSWSLSQTWISVGIAVFLLSFATGAGFLGPESGRLSKLIANRPADDPEVQQRIGRVIVISRIELILLIVVIFDMVVKPG